MTQTTTTLSQYCLTSSHINTEEMNDTKVAKRLSIALF